MVLEAVVGDHWSNKQAGVAVLGIYFVVCFCSFVLLRGRYLFLILGIPAVACFCSFVLLGGRCQFFVLGIPLLLGRPE